MFTVLAIHRWQVRHVYQYRYRYRPSLIKWFPPPGQARLSLVGWPVSTAAASSGPAFQARAADATCKAVMAGEPGISIYTLFRECARNVDVVLPVYSVWPSCMYRTWHCHANGGAGNIVTISMSCTNCQCHVLSIVCHGHGQQPSWFIITGRALA